LTVNFVCVGCKVST